MVTPASAPIYAPCDQCGDRYRVQGLTLRKDGRRLCFLCERGIAVPPRRPPHAATPIHRAASIRETWAGRGSY
jgi:hypothetical protein